jgi:hypothetical protein
VVWDPCSGREPSALAQTMRAAGFDVICSDKAPGDDDTVESGVVGGLDFLGFDRKHTEPLEVPTWPHTAGVRRRVDLIVTRPPTHIRNAFLTRIREHGVPWLLLLPLVTVNGLARIPLLRGVELIVVPSRCPVAARRAFFAWWPSVHGVAASQQRWHHTSRVPLIPFKLGATLLRHALLASRPDFCLVALAQLHAAHYYPGFFVADCGRLVENRKGGRAQHRVALQKAVTKRSGDESSVTSPDISVPPKRARLDVNCDS